MTGQLNLFQQGEDLPLFQAAKPKSYGEIKPIVGSHGKPLRCTPIEPDPIQELALLIAHGSDDPTAGPEARVSYYCEMFPEDLPDGFTDEHRRQLIRLVSLIS